MSTENLYSKLTATDLSAIILKGSPNPSERDAGFCSGSSEGGNDLSIDHYHQRSSPQHLEQPNSPTDASEDSVEVKVTPICYTRNKRKSTEPSRVISGRGEELGPLKKRIRYTTGGDEFISTSTVNSTDSIATNNSDLLLNNHFRPWDKRNEGNDNNNNRSQLLPHELMPNPAEILVRHPGVTTLHRNLLVNSNNINSNNDDIDDDCIDAVQIEPLALIAKKSPSVINNNKLLNSIKSSSSSTSLTSSSSQQLSFSSNNKKLKNDATGGNKMKNHSNSSNSSKVRNLIKSKDLKTSDNNNDNSISSCSKLSSNYEKSDSNNNSHMSLAELSAHLSQKPENLRQRLELDQQKNLESCGSSINGSSTTSSSSSSVSVQQQQQRPQQRNYKNMTRERRIEANARERTRVHTISAAYETLRKSVPAYSNTQKLSKLSVLRVACSYILSLSRMAGYDYSEDQSQPSIASCIEMVTKTIQTEGKIRKKKDE